MSLPVEGLLLRPQQGEGESSQSGSTRSDVGVLNTSNQEDSSDEELVGGEDHAAAGSRGWGWWVWTATWLQVVDQRW